MPFPDPAQYDSFAAQYEEHAAAAPYGGSRPVVDETIGWVQRRCADSNI